MPTYEYECTQCGKVIELFQSMKDKAKRTLPTDCKQCSNKAPVVRRISGGGAVIFKGSGFYQTDYRTDSYKEAAKKETESSSTAEKKPESKGDAKPDTKAADPKPPASESSTGSSTNEKRSKSGKRKSSS